MTTPVQKRLSRPSQTRVDALMEGRVRVGEGSEVGELTGGRDDLEFKLVMSNEARQGKPIFVLDSTP
jgi:hypothetical protein